MDMLWSGWGDPAQATPLPEPVVALLRDFLGVKPLAAPPVELAGITPPPSRLGDDVVRALAAVAEVRTDAESRIRHTRGKSTPDLLRIRAGSVTAAPDAVVLPADHDGVSAVLAACAAHGVAVVPFGGGTSVVGGLAPESTGFVALDLRRLNRLLSLDPVSRTATLQPGLRAPEAEALLNERGFTLGHFPQSYEWATIGGFAAARSSGQASAGYGRFDEMVVGLTAATPTGTLDLGRAPRSAAGPDLRQLLLGSEGALGVITSVTVRIRPLPAEKLYEGWRFESFAAGSAALRRLAQDGPLPTVLRLSDETETMIGLARPDQVGTTPAQPDARSGPAALSDPTVVADPLPDEAAGTSGAAAVDSAAASRPGTAAGGASTSGASEPGAATDGGGSGGCLAIVGFEGTAAEVAQRRAGVAAVLTDAGGAYLGVRPGEGWAHGRYSAPYLRDALLDVGAFAETLETATFWSGLPELYEAVRGALGAALPGALVMCHISHVYAAGASLYFTVVGAQGDDPLATWRTAKQAANDAILAAGGTISHHHGVGTDHRDWYAREIGPLGVAVLQAVKRELDPTGILNPGVLVPRDGHGLPA